MFYVGDVQVLQGGSDTILQARGVEVGSWVAMAKDASVSDGQGLKLCAEAQVENASDDVRRQLARPEGDMADRSSTSTVKREGSFPRESS